jgi:ferredoxin
MLGIYFSGTGNTEHCGAYFTSQYSNSKCISIENPTASEEIAKHNMLVFGYPVYFSNAPKIVSDFIANNKLSFSEKKVYIIATMGLFSGDGTGVTARLLRKYGVTIVGGLHLKMPDCIGDEKLLKKTAEETRVLIRKAETKIDTAVTKLKNGKPDRDGLGFFAHIAGLFGQRLWFYGKTANYKEKPNVNKDKCIGCGKCAELCPMNNIIVTDKKAISGKQCTLCYRCFNYCPTKALTILGKKVYEQYLFEKCR